MLAGPYDVRDAAECVDHLYFKFRQSCLLDSPPLRREVSEVVSEVRVQTIDVLPLSILELKIQILAACVEQLMKRRQTPFRLVLSFFASYLEAN
jgi:hypothetical protein